MAPAFEPVGCPDGNSQRSPPETTFQSCMSGEGVSTRSDAKKNATKADQEKNEEGTR
jgi:hypothetical protein